MTRTSAEARPCSGEPERLPAPLSESLSESVRVCSKSTRQTCMLLRPRTELYRAAAAFRRPPHCSAATAPPPHGPSVAAAGVSPGCPGLAAGRPAPRRFSARPLRPSARGASAGAAAQICHGRPGPGLASRLAAGRKAGNAAAAARTGGRGGACCEAGKAGAFRVWPARGGTSF